MLVIIDAQNEYSEGKLKVTNAASSGKAIAGLLEKYRQGSGKIVHVTHSTPDGAPVFTPGTDLAKEFSELKAKDGEKTISKHHPSSFADTDLDQYLKSTGLKKIVLTGYMVSRLGTQSDDLLIGRQAHVCVSTTARDGARLGYDVLLAEDAVGDRDIPGASGAEVTKMVMHELGDAFATVIQSSDVEQDVELR